MQVKSCTQIELEDAINFAYIRCKTEAGRRRPYLLNASKEEICKDFNKFIDAVESDILLVYKNTKLVGVTGLYWIESDSYVSLTRGVFTEGEFTPIAEAIYSYLLEQFRGYSLYINIAKEEVDANSYYNKKGFELLEDAVMYKLTEFSNLGEFEHIQRVNDDNIDPILNFIQPHLTEDTYWNTERLRGSLNKFYIFAYFDEGIKAAMYAQKYKNNSTEIMCLIGEGDEMKLELLHALANACKDDKRNELLLYTEESSEVSLVKPLGYTYKDSNMCYIKKLI